MKLQIFLLFNSQIVFHSEMLKLKQTPIWLSEYQSNMHPTKLPGLAVGSIGNQLCQWWNPEQQTYTYGANDRTPEIYLWC